MSRVLTIIFLTAFCTSLKADILGVWRTPPAKTGEYAGGYVYVKIQACADSQNSICGVIVKAFDEQDREGNPPFIGKTMLMNLTKQGNNTWTKGKIWAPDVDKTYHSKLRLLDKNTLKVSGCILGGLFCRSQVWNRILSQP
ncbi:MAG: DUF2147 domain-containing protein [Granulosicoccus sp.]|nr:DUF2147 domain-containing protein [Granulosicoccus sp.]